MINGLVPEYQHSVYLGVTRQPANLWFDKNILFCFKEIKSNQVSLFLFFILLLWVAAMGINQQGKLGSC